MNVNTLDFNMSSRAQVSETESAGFFMSKDDGQFGGMFAEKLNRMLETQETADSASSSLNTRDASQVGTGFQSVPGTADKGAVQVITPSKPQDTVVDSQGGTMVVGTFSGISRWHAEQTSQTVTLETRSQGQVSGLNILDFLKFITESLTSELSGLKGSEWVDKFKAFLSGSGKSLEGVSVGKNGIKALEEMLVKAGFPRTAVADILEELQASAGTSSVKLSDILDGLGRLEASTEEDTTDPSESLLLPVSLLPAIQSLLTTFGVPEDITAGIIADINSDGQGLDLDLLINKLQTLETLSFLSGKASDLSTSQFGEILAQLGLDSQVSGKDSLGLNDVLSYFEAVRKEGKAALNLSLNNASGAPLLPETGVGGLVADSVARPASPRSRVDQAQASTSMVTALSAGKDDNGIAGLLNTFLNSLTDTRSNTAFFQPGVLEGDVSEAFTTVMNGAPGNFTDMMALLGSRNAGDGIALQAGNEDFLQVIKNLTALFEAARTSAQNTFTARSGSDDTPQILHRLTRLMTKEVPESGQVSDSGLKGMGTSDQQAMSALKTRAAAQVLPAYVTNQVGKSLIRSINNGDSELRLQLKPPELGRLIMTIDTHGDSIKIHVLTENQAARDILSSHSLELKTTLAGSGISIESFDVEMGKNFQQSMADARYQSSGSGSGRNRNRQSFRDAVDSVDGEILPGAEYIGVNGALHFVA
ncbi:MAG: flagellar hook-length control protein FliK [Pseudomonadota bacterium]